MVLRHLLTLLRIYVTVGRPSVCLSVPSIGSMLDAERRRLQQISIDSYRRRAAGAGTQQQTRVASCWALTQQIQHKFVLFYFTRIRTALRHVHIAQTHFD